MSEQLRNEALRRRSHQAALRTWGLYLLSLVAWVTAVLALIFVGFLMCSQFTWYESSFLYHLFSWVRDYIFFVGMAAVLAGWVVISYQFIGKMARDSELLLAGAEELAQPGADPIRLPPGLKRAEDQLNLARERAFRAAQAAREAEQRKNDLVVYLAHDLKTPLTSVIGYLTLLRDEPELPVETRARYTGVVLDKAERLEELINEFFDITRFNLSHLELELQDVDLRRMLEQVVSEFGPMLREKGMTCNLDLPGELRLVCDPDKMARVFDNLLNNACHYAYPNSALQVEGHPEGERVVLTFSNAGRTIPPEKLERMFEQFFRLDSSRGTGSGNAGLGLAIAREIVEAHGGAIYARSADEQIIFTVLLPLDGPA
ncbi:sensor histidine kinase [Flavonifractor sp. An306]|uniref:sensor histidine kinase n=1 Tax=Flavonifractor sp. An306 TaxID=1965629 RepID=UPI0026137AC1|nr:HAMP domain-containing sensor histidine kinase [Flavonifractor sp. An306]